MQARELTYLVEYAEPAVVLNYLLAFCLQILTLERNHTTIYESTVMQTHRPTAERHVNVLAL